MEEGAVSQGMQASPGSRKSKETDPFLAPPEGTNPAETVIFTLVKLTLDF
jgi:hypothetical protein